VIVNIDYAPHSYQMEFHRDESRFRVISGGRRVGKTKSALQEILKHCLTTTNGKAFWVGTTFREARELGYDEFLTYYDTLKPAIKHIHITQLKVTFVNGCQLFFKGSDKPDSCRGRGLTFLVCDEAAFMKPGLWSKVLRPSLSDRQGKAVLTSTPNGRNWFYETFNNNVFASYNWPTSMNPLITKEELDSVRREISEIDFNQEYLGHFITKAGQIYADFDDANIIPPITVNRSTHDVYIGCDFGFASATAVVFMAVDRATQNKVVQFDELEVSRMQMDKVLVEMKIILCRHHLDIKDVTFVYTDPAGNAEELSSGISPVDMIRKQGFKVINKGSNIEPGLAMVRSWIKNIDGERRFFITTNCGRTEECMRAYSYKESKEGYVSEETDKTSGYDHLPDAIRYFFVNRFDQAKYVATVPEQSSYGMTTTLKVMKRCDKCKRPFVSCTPKLDPPYLCSKCIEES